MTVMFVAGVPSKLTVAPALKPVPVSDTAVPPESGPELGEREVIVGAGLGGGLPLLLARIVVSLVSAPGALVRYADGDRTI